MSKFAKKHLDKTKRVLRNEKDKQRWIDDAYDSSLGNNEFWNLNSSWKHESVPYKEERQKEWKNILGKYYCKMYCYEVAKFTRPTSQSKMITDNYGLYSSLFSIVYSILTKSLSTVIDVHRTKRKQVLFHSLTVENFSIWRKNDDLDEGVCNQVCFLFIYCFDNL